MYPVDTTRSRVEQSTTSGHLLDSDSLQRRHEYQKWQEELGNFLTDFDWQLYATPTFRFPVTFTQAQRVVGEWVAKFGPQAYAFAGYQKGEAGGRTHAHLLVGGLVGQIAKTRAGRLWKSGNIKIEPYDPNRGAAWYVSTFPEGGEIIGTLVRRTRRTRQQLYTKTT